MWEHFLGPGTSHPWLPHWRRGGREEGGGRSGKRVVGWAWVGGWGGGLGWHEDLVERETCARAIPFLCHRRPRISTSCLAVPTLLQSRCADRRGGAGGGAGEWGAEK